MQIHLNIESLGDLREVLEETVRAELDLFTKKREIESEMTPHDEKALEASLNNSKAKLLAEQRKYIEFCKKNDIEPNPEVMGVFTKSE